MFIMNYFPKDLADIRSVAWALSQETPLEPLVLFSGSRVLYAFNVKRLKIVSSLRGHGDVSRFIVC
jgi:polycomb protein EED